MPDRAWACLALAVSCGALSLSGCRSRAVTRTNVDAQIRFGAPADDRGETCSDVGELRVCWEAEQPTIVNRTLPNLASISPLGFRCVGQGAARTCFDRTREVGLFECEGSTCTQMHPRLPDDSEWTCIDDAGATICAGSEESAGVPHTPGAVSDGWTCGDRTALGPPGKRVCIDLAPDFPDGHARGWRCRFDHEHGVRRVCTRDLGAHVLGDACDAQHPCIDGASCVSSRCVPKRPSPSCWLDADCKNGTCRFAACTVPS